MLSHTSLFCCVTVELQLTILLCALFSYSSLFCCVQYLATPHHFVVCTVELHLTILLCALLSYISLSTIQKHQVTHKNAIMVHLHVCCWQQYSILRSWHTVPHIFVWF